MGFFFLVCVHALWLQARRTFPGGKGCCCIGSVPALTLARRGGPSLHGTATVAVGNPSGAGRQFLPPRKEQRKIIIKKKISQKKKKKSQATIQQQNPTNPAEAVGQERESIHKSSECSSPARVKRSQPPDPRCQRPRSAPSFPDRRGHNPRRPQPGRAEARRGGGSLQSRSRGGPAALRSHQLFSFPRGGGRRRHTALLLRDTSRPRRGRCWPRGAPAPPRRAGGRRCPRRSPHSSGGGMRLGAALPGPASASRPNRQPPRRASRPPAPIGNAGARPGRTAPPSSAPGCGVSLPRCAPPLAAPARGRCASRRRAPARGGGTCAAPSAAEPGPAGSGSGAGRAAPGAHRLSRPARAGAPQRRAPSPAAAELRGGKPGRRAAPPGSAPGAAAGAGGTAGAELVEVRESRREVGFFASPWGFFRSPQAAAAPRLCGPSRPRPPPAFRGCFGGD